MVPKEKQWRVLREITRNADVMEAGLVMSDTEARMRLGPAFSDYADPHNRNSPLELVAPAAGKKRPDTKEA